MVKFILIDFVAAVVAILAMYGLGNLTLIDTVIPMEGIEVDEWMAGYHFCAILAGIVALLTSVVWYCRGRSYTGGSGIETIYYVMWACTAVLAVVIDFVELPPSIEGAWLAHLYLIVAPCLHYWLVTLFASPDPVKYIPLLAERMHN